MTPLMKQFWEIKNQHTDKVLLFRMGDFYEMFHEDAVLAAPILGIALTSRNKKAQDETPMCGVPHHSISGPIAKLLASGHKVAICDQLEDPAEAKGIVKRGVTRILSPGMVYDPETLNEKQANYVASYDEHSIAFLDASTGEAFYYFTMDAEERKKLLYLLRPQELILTSLQKAQYMKTRFEEVVVSGFNPHLTQFDDSNETKLQRFEDLPQSATRLLNYAVNLQGEDVLSSIEDFEKRDLSDKMSLSETCLRHLEVFHTYKGEEKGSLYFAINRTKTSAGARLLKNWLQFPLKNINLIQKRQDQVQYWVDRPQDLKILRKKLQGMGDIERRLGKINHSNCHPRDLLALNQSIEVGMDISPLCPGVSEEKLQVASRLFKIITEAINEEAPLNLKSGGFIRKGYSEDLDRLVYTAEHSQNLLMDLEAREKEQTGIPSLKIRFNNVFGYYIEVTNTHKDKVPDHYKRKQTLANAERYVTEELHKLETEILSARTKRFDLETKLFEDIRHKVLRVSYTISSLAKTWSELDVISSLAWLATEQSYKRPTLTDKRVISIKSSRHPVIEQEVKKSFVPNDVELRKGECLLLTGPNMAGKSTLMRQVACSLILAQIGSFIPCSSSELCPVDRIFTRIGASDYLSEGLSTFMVEMKETAEMLRECTRDSLVILDEVGRGTSTYDGMSLAQAILEYIVGKKSPFTLFATHYHEITVLDRTYPQIKNAHMSIEEDQSKKSDIHFLYTLKMGPASKSYGIQVAKLAGLPVGVTLRAQKLLDRLETSMGGYSGAAAPQLSLMDAASDMSGDMGGASGQLEGASGTPSEAFSEVLKDLEGLDVQKMTPMEALNRLNEWQQRLS